MTAEETALVSQTSIETSSISLCGARSGNISDKSKQVVVHDMSQSDMQYQKIFRVIDREIALKMRTLGGQICANNYFLYSQGSRYTGYEALKNNNWNVKNISNDVYLDCSSFVATCLIYAGVSVNINGFTTATEYDRIMATGKFRCVDQLVDKDHRDDLLVGDILWSNSGHTEIVYSIHGTSGDTEYGGGAYGSSSSGGLFTSIISFADDFIQSVVTGFTNLFNNFVSATYNVGYETIETTETHTQLLRADYDIDLVDTSLLTYPNCVQVPFIQLKINDYTFGTYKELKNGLLQYPNYINAMEVNKVNGEVNTYNIEIVHVIEPGADPNILDKIFSGAGYGAKVYISYGDYMEPSFTYKEEEAILLKVSNNVDFSRSVITYALECTSNATALFARFFNFPAIKQQKPSDVIKDLLWNKNSTYGLLDVFQGMKNKTKASSFIASDDIAVDVPAQNSMNPIAYLNLLTTYMCSDTSTIGSPIKDSVYKFCIYDTIDQGTPAQFTDAFKSDSEDVTGSYFKIKKITGTKGQTTLSTDSVYEVDIGYPTTENVMQFKVDDDQSWAMLYDYAGDIKETVYNIDNNGNLEAEYIPKLAVSTTLNKMTEAQRTWWTNMTSFPITAILTIKGLITPVILMDYIRINALFYGQRHVSSGLYVVTQQMDSISANGYITTLTLLRIGSDESYIKTIEQKVTKNIPVIKVSDSGTSISGKGRYNTNSALYKVLSGVGLSTIFTANSYSSSDSGTTTKSTSIGSSFTGRTSNIEYLLDFFVKEKGLSFQGACGILGNMMHESNVNPIKLGEKFLSALDDIVNTGSSKLSSNPYRNNEQTYTDEIESGKRTKEQFMYPLREFTTSTSKAGHDYGLVQWCYPERKGQLYDYAVSTTGIKNIGTVKLQGNFVMYELENGGSTMTRLLDLLKTTNNVSDAANMFYIVYEMSHSWDPNYDYDGSSSSRISYAKGIYDEYIDKYYQYN